MQPAKGQFKRYRLQTNNEAIILVIQEKWHCPLLKSSNTVYDVDI
jgi:hypothetical protein